MTASPLSTSSRVCPSCGARNSAVSLFCAECGASLNGGNGESSGYSPYAPAADDTQATVAFTPAPAAEPAADSGSTRLSRPVTSTVTPFTPSWDEPAVLAPASTDAWDPQPVTSRTVAGPSGMRGFVLGVLGFLLILLVFVAWLWAGILDDGTRTSISDFFGFLDFRN